VSLELAPGEVLGIAGESGCGKSTLAYALTGMLRPPARLTAGVIEYAGPDGRMIDLGRADPRQLRALRWHTVSMMFQSAMNALNPVTTIGRQFADVFRAHRPQLDRRSRDERAAGLLELVGIDPARLRSYPHELSGGMRQRVVIAMALALDPKIVVLDEPTTALDVLVQREILDELQRLREELGFAMVFITHDLGLLLEISDRLAVMYAGRIVEYGLARRQFHSALQIVFQDPFASLNPMHTVARHLRRPLARYRRPQGRDAMRAAVLDLLRLVNLTPEADIAAKYPHELSGGQRQRVAIARALATGPRVLPADEPVSMLDVSIRLEILNLLDRLARERGLAVLYVTHDLATARHFSSHIMVMYRGQVVESGPSDQVILNPAHPYTRMLADAAPDPTMPREQAEAKRRERTARRAAGTARPQEATAGQGCVFRSRCPDAMPVCAQPPAQLPAGAEHHARCWLLDPAHAAPVGRTP
jgi:oligopeptide/dipeptide ABC transporter ATP-binding protein